VVRHAIHTPTKTTMDRQKISCVSRRYDHVRSAKISQFIEVFCPMSCESAPAELLPVGGTARDFIADHYEHLARRRPALRLRGCSCAKIAHWHLAGSRMPKIAKVDIRNESGCSVAPSSIVTG
jgi:hypothetical protein